jgi:hypothetical protein
MANLFYKDHFITVVGRTDEISQFWIPVADISWETDGQKESHTITGGLDWISNWHDVERHMVELAKAWVDGQATRHLNRSELKRRARRTGSPNRGEVAMARLLYKGNLITVDCTQKNRGLWSPTVDIRWKYDGGSDVKLSTDKLFKSNDKAETFGLKMGRAWADGHMLDKR